MNLVFVHKCQLMPNGATCPSQESTVYIAPNMADFTSYVMPTIRCVYTNDELKLQKVNGQFV